MNCLEDINQDYFITHLPIQLDATCNGYQHIAMLGRDAKLSENLNLCESSIDDIPKIYTLLFDNLLKHIL